MQAATILQRLEKTLAGDSDSRLLERFIAERDPAAFRLIVTRHGPMVYRVCRRLLHDDSDAADAFQAVFLVLLQKAAAIRTQTSLAAWLYGVARQVSLRMRSTSRRRQEREARASRPEAVPAEDCAGTDLREILDEELSRLPERLRSPLVLCYLEGLTQDEAAAHLGLAKRTLQRYLESGKTLLGIRLTQRGVILSAALLATVASESMAALPTGLADETSALASSVLGGKSLASHFQTLNILTREVIRHMSPTRPSWKWLAIALVGFGLGTAIVGPRLGGQPPVANEFEDWTLALKLGAPDSAKPGDAIAWGKPADGLKAGIGFRRGEEHSCREGSSATLVVYLRNESQAPITVTHNENVFEEFVPHVRDSNGKAVRIHSGAFHSGDVPRVTRTLEPGETVRLDFAWFLVRSTDWKGPVEAPTLRAKPGRYTVACENIPLRLKGRDRDDMHWSTGWVELSVEGGVAGGLEGDRGDSRIESLIRSKLGLRLTVADPAKLKANAGLRGGLEVAEVDQESVAAKAGIRKGDILVGLEKWETTSLENVAFVLAQLGMTSTSQLSFFIVRDGQIRSGTMKGGPAENKALDEAKARLGRAEAECELRKVELDRVKKLYEAKAIEKNLVDEAKANFSSAEAARDVAKAALVLLQSALAKQDKPQQSEAVVAVRELMRAEALVSRWQSEVERLRKLFSQGAIEKKMLDEAESQLKAAQAARDAAKAKPQFERTVDSKPDQNSQPELDAANAALRRAEDEYQRWKKEVEVDKMSVERGVLDRQTFQEAEHQLKAAEAARDIAKAKVEATAREQAKAKANHQAEIEVAKAGVVVAEAEYQRRKHMLDRNLELEKKGVIGKDAIQESEDDLRIAAANLELAKVKLRVLQGNGPAPKPATPLQESPPGPTNTKPRTPPSSNVPAAESDESSDTSLLDAAEQRVRAGDYTTAEKQLREHVRSYPKADCNYARFLLGFTLLKQAEAASRPKVTPSRAREMQSEALSLFRSIVTDIDANDSKSERETAIRFQASAFALQSLLDLRQPAEVRSEAANMLDRYRGTIEALVVWSKVYFAFEQEKDERKAKDVWDRMKRLFEELPPTAFTCDVGEYSRDYWVRNWHF